MLLTGACFRQGHYCIVVLGRGIHTYVRIWGTVQVCGKGCVYTSCTHSIAVHTYSTCRYMHVYTCIYVMLSMRLCIYLMCIYLMYLMYPFPCCTYSTCTYMHVCTFMLCLLLNQCCISSLHAPAPASLSAWCCSPMSRHTPF